jgi:hypothetical protein
LNLKKLLILACGILAIVGFLGAVQAQAGNITIWDTMNPKGVNQGWEDQEVEPNCVWGQKWDLEAFAVGNKTLTMIGGYDFKNGASNGSQTFMGGDIFISTSGNALFGATAPAGPGSNGVQTITNNFGYNYVLRMDFGTGKYQILRIDQNSYLSVYYNQNSGSNPWRLASGGTVVGGGDLTYAAGLTDAGTGFLGGNHYSVTLADLPDYLLVNNSLFHYTYECGNDDLMGRVPIPGAVWLLGSGLVGLGLLGRRRKRA